MLSPAPALYPSAPARLIPQPAVQAKPTDNHLLGERDVWLLATLLQRRAAERPDWNWAQADHPLPRPART